MIFNDLAVPPQTYYSDTLIHIMYLLVPSSLLIAYIVLKERLDMGTLPALIVWIYEREKLMKFVLGATLGLCSRRVSRSTYCVGN